MYTQCPNCDSSFPINILQLKAAQGKVRCGHCNVIFNALLNLTEAPPEIPTVGAKREDDTPAAPALKPATEGSAVERKKPPARTHTRQAPPVQDAPPAHAEPSAVSEVREAPVQKAKASLPETGGAAHAAPAAPVSAPASTPFTVLGEEPPAKPASAARPQPAPGQAGSGPNNVESYKPPKATRAEAPLSKAGDAAPDEAPAGKPAPPVTAPATEPKESKGEPAPQEEASPPPKIVARRAALEDELREDELAELPPLFVIDRRATPRTTGAPPPMPPDEPEELEEAREDYAAAHKPAYNWAATALWALGIVALLALLIAQYAYFMREDLARYAALRPALENLCAVVNTLAPCEIPLRRDVSQIAMQEREVTAHPSVADALMASVILVNKAPFPQPYPSVELTLADTSGTIVAKRRFQPSEYLEKDAAIKSGMAPGQVVPVLLELAAPSLDFQLASWDFALF